MLSSPRATREITKPPSGDYKQTPLNETNEAASTEVVSSNTRVDTSNIGATICKGIGTSIADRISEGKIFDSVWVINEVRLDPAKGKSDSRGAEERPKEPPESRVVTPSEPTIEDKARVCDNNNVGAMLSMGQDENNSEKFSTGDSLVLARKGKEGTPNKGETIETSNAHPTPPNRRMRGKLAT